MVWFTLTVVCFHVIDKTGTNIGLTADDVAGMTPQQISDARTGSIFNVLSWWSWAGLMWSCKGCMLFFYARIAFRTWQTKMVKYTAWIAAITYIGSFLVNLFKCIPVNKNWDVLPLPGNCPAGALNLYFTGICNFITDVIILIIPFPLLARVHLPWKKRFLVVLMLGSGVFTIIVSVLRLVFSIAAVYERGPKDLRFRLGWCTRENFTAIVIINVPVIFSSINRIYNPSSERDSIGSYTHSQPLTDVGTHTATMRKSSYGPGYAANIAQPAVARIGTATTAGDVEYNDKASEASLRQQPTSIDQKVSQATSSEVYLV